MKSRLNVLLSLIAVLAFASTSFAATIYVDAATGNDADDGSTWALAKATIQAAVAVAQADGASADEILVATGDYTEDVTIATTGGITLYGGLDNGDAIGAQDVQGKPVVLDDVSGAISINNADNVIIDGVIISGQTAGDAIEIDGGTNSVLIVDCVTTGVTGPRSLDNTTSTTIVRNCQFVNCTSTTAGVVRSNTEMTIDSCQFLNCFTNNNATIVFLQWSGGADFTGLVENCVLSNCGGQAWFAGHIMGRGNARIKTRVINCTVDDVHPSYANSHAVGARDSADLYAQNNIVSNVGSGAAFLVQNASGTCSGLINNNVYNCQNAASDGGSFWYNVANTNTNLAYATGNTDYDPQYVNAAGDNYRLTPGDFGVGSACIDAGLAAGAPSDDIEGTARPIGAGVDQGAYETAPAANVAEWWMM